MIHEEVDNQAPVAVAVGNEPNEIQNSGLYDDDENEEGYEDPLEKAA